MELKNRIVFPGITTNFGGINGEVTDVAVNYYARRSNGGYGLVITETAYPAPEWGAAHGIYHVAGDRHMPGLARLARAIQAGGAKACLQLAQKGHFIAQDTIMAHHAAPSAFSLVQLPDEHPQAFTIAEIEGLIQKYGEAARRAKECGFDCVEFHGAHGYLPLEFFSGYTNRRTDHYGGNTKNRARFILEIIRCIKELAGADFPVIYRMSAYEDVPGGVTLEESVQLARWLQEAGADALHVSVGSWDSRLQKYQDAMAGKIEGKDAGLENGIGISTWIPSHYTARGLLVGCAAEIRKASGLPTLAVCSLTPEMGEDILSRGDADFISFGRQGVADPDWPQKIIDGEPESIRRCLRCNECIATILHGIPVRCAVNPEVGKEETLCAGLIPAAKKRKVAVVGSGPAGLNAALAAAARGHSVTIFEKAQTVGGMLNALSVPSFKAEYRDYLRWLKDEAQRRGVELKLGIEATAKLLCGGTYEKIIVATGAVPASPPVKGLAFAVDFLEILGGLRLKGKQGVVCGGGLVGTEIAMLLAEEGYAIALMEELPQINQSVYLYDRWVINARLKALGVSVMTGCRILEIGKDSVIYREMGKEAALPVDFAVSAFGMRADRSFFDTLKAAAPSMEIVMAGDVLSARKIIDAVHEGYHAGRRI